MTKLELFVVMGLDGNAWKSHLMPKIQLDEWVRATVSGGGTLFSYHMAILADKRKLFSTQILPRAVFNQ